MSTEMTLEQRMSEALRMVKLRQEQMHSAALTRDCGEIDGEDWDGFAARYAAAVREWRVLQHIQMTQQPSMAATTRGATWVQG